MILFRTIQQEVKARLGFVIASNVDTQKPLELLELRLAEVLKNRVGQELTASEDQLRQAVRNMLRYQSYKPTGRSKPASEYLLRTANEGNFPRINTLVDINNYISLKYVLPISVWDIDKSESTEFVFRQGLDSDEYVFNPSGQTILLKDLIGGFRVYQGKEEPIVNPVKDSLLTKTDANTSRIALVIYFPMGSDESILQSALDEFTTLLIEAGGTIEQVEIS